MIHININSCIYIHNIDQYMHVDNAVMICGREIMIKNHTCMHVELTSIHIFMQGVCNNANLHSNKIDMQLS